MRKSKPPPLPPSVQPRAAAGNGGLGDDDLTPPGPTFDPTLRGIIAAIDNWILALVHTQEALQALRREIIENPGREAGYFRELVTREKERHAQALLAQVALERS